MKHSYHIDLNEGDSLFETVPELAEEAQRRSNNSRPPTAWIERARTVLGPAAEALVVCGSMEEAWLATAVAKELGPFSAIHAVKVLNGRRAVSWKVSLIRSEPGAIVDLALQERVPEARKTKRGPAPAFDLYVRVQPIYPALVDALTAADPDRSVTGLVWGTSLAIEYDGGGHRSDPVDDKNRDLRAFLGLLTPTLRVPPGIANKNREWGPFRTVGTAVRRWADTVAKAAVEIDDAVAALVQAHTDELVSFAVLVDRAHDDMLAGNIEEGIEALGALRRDSRWPTSPSWARQSPERTLLLDANRALRKLARQATHDLKGALPPDVTLVPPRLPSGLA